VALTLRYAVRSDLGLVRGNNEDSGYAGPRLLAIADGMGGHAAGEVASKIVIGTMEPLDDDRVPGDLLAAMRNAVLEANHRIADAVEQDRALDGMGTTLTALRFAGSQVALVHVGDSRAYLLRGDELAQITHDDTYVQYLVDSGKLTAEEAKDHPRKSVILRALRGADVEPDVAIRESRAGDRYLLCSDGLSDVVSTETMAEALRIADPQECADRLVELALRSGGPDNVTVIAADVVDARPGDVVDDVPVRDGAFVDPAATEVSPTDSAAERAAAISRPLATPAAAAEEPRKRRRRWATPAIILGILVLIFGALGGTYAWAQTQYYVGRAGNEVAIYQGVNASFGPIKFSEVYRNTDIKMSDLYPAFQSQVESGITASSKGDAVRIVQRLHKERLPVCPPKTSPSTSPSTSASTSSSASATRSPSASPPKSASPRVSTSGSRNPGALAGSTSARASAPLRVSPSRSVTAPHVGALTRSPVRGVTSSAKRVTSAVRSTATPLTSSSPLTSPSSSSPSMGSLSGLPSGSASSGPTCRNSR
jgi:protein phosphatase